MKKSKYVEVVEFLKSDGFECVSDRRSNIQIYVCDDTVVKVEIVGE